MKKLLLLAAVCFGLFTGCETDFEVNSVWKETTVVYGLLDINQSVQMIKVTKAFLGEGDANQFAQNPDSSNYNPADIEVRLLARKPGSTDQVILLHDSLLPNKKPGSFSTQKNIVYVTYAKLDSSKTYTLEVKNLKTGNLCTASTPVIETVRYNKIGNNNLYVQFSTAPSSPTINGTYSDPILTWTSKPNARTYQTNVRFYYIEKNLISGNMESKYLDWLQAPVVSNNISGGEVLQQKISGLAFYQFLQSQLTEDGNLSRTASYLEFTISVGSDELYNYINVNTPSGDLNQDKPVYTNVSNGLGIFSSRTNFETVRYLCNESLSPPRLCNSSTSSMAELVVGKFTNKLGFKYN